jgi:prepilin-type processing-associated H-X9-DG protein
MRRRGIKVIELLVVIAIIAVFLAIFPHGCGEGREAARRAQCVCNLKMLGLGLANYYDVYQGLLPPASGGLPEPNDFSMKVRLLPFLESSPFYDSINQSVLATDPENWTARCTPFSSFVCPSDTNRPGGLDPHPSVLRTANRVASSSYPNNIGTLYRNNGGKFDGPAYVTGDPSLGPPVSIMTIIDGTSYTVGFSEWVRGREGSRSRTKDQSAVYSSSLLFPARNANYPLDPQFGRVCRASRVLDPALGDHKGQLWMRDNCGEGGGYSHVMLPNDRSCTFWGDPPNPIRTMIGASSHHPGGVNVGFLDGSVRFVKDRVSPAAWRTIATYAGKEVLAPESY